MDLRTRINSAVEFLRSKTDHTPAYGLVLGTGLGELGEKIETVCSIPFNDVPGFVKSTAVSHQGNLLMGSLGGQPVMAMQGRVHFYEGYSMQEITLPIRVMRAMGCHSLVMSNAVGGMNPLMDAGDNIVPIF